MEKKDNVYDIVTSRILEELENGTIPWNKPWKATSMPKNLRVVRSIEVVECLAINL